MYAVVFEVEPRRDQWDEYLSTAGELRPELERIEGFIENRRFRSRTREGVVLSLSLWQDAASVVRWRNHAGHRLAQVKGRTKVFRDYHLRVGQVVENAAASDRVITLLEQPADETRPAGWQEWDVFDGIVDAADHIMLLAGPNRGGALPAAKRRLSVRIVRDYGMRERTEAPQKMAPVP